MATISLRAFEVAKTKDGNSPWTLDFQEAASSTFLKGALLSFNAAGRLTEASDNSTRIVGIAAEAGHNYSTTGTDKTCKVWVADENTFYVGNLGSTSVTALTDVGGRFGLTKGATYWAVDKTATKANARVIAVDLDPRDNIGDTNGRVHFCILSDFNVLTGTS